MSIINDALKKAQAELAKKQANRAPVNPETVEVVRSVEKATAVNTLHPQKSWFTSVLLLISVFCLVIGFLVAVLVFLLNQSSTIVNTPTIQTETTQATAIQKTVARPSVPTPTANNPFVLSGIMMMGDKRVALINDDIYELGETIQGKKIVNITLDKVEIADNDKIIVLEVRKKP